ncbi:Histidinol-phosphatase [Pleurostoma richardsiae]|uniref:Histidinol-phosphatase n=1 Tax=Pleurostoma richardsiae TaxID=41990 RepID=A0AA38VHL1_9PEZI|nr:Histidinol-phosphatase [Pleurostoma richardsiae]
MAFTMHSHSGQFCPGHAKDQLEDVIRHAISIGYKTIGLTEHMPRYELDELYPEEMDDPAASLAALPPRHEAYLAEAQRLQAAYAGRIHVLIGFEGEFIRAAAYAAHVRRLAAHPAVDYFVGSLHHTRGVPIDFDRAAYLRAVRASAGAAGEPGERDEGEGGEGSERDLYAAYYDEQLEMLRALRPRVVGHFDLIRLLSADPGRDLRAVWPDVWARVVRNLEFAAGCGAWLECNSSALRKGLAEPYPSRQIAEEWLRLGGKFTFSDDSHGIAQVATNYLRNLDYLESLGVTEVWTLERDPHPGTRDGEKAALREKSVTLKEFRESLRIGEA